MLLKDMYLDLNLPVVDEEQKAIEEEKQERLDDRDGSDPLAMLINTMAEEDDEKENPFCAKTHKKCGHTCQGVKNERNVCHVSRPSALRLPGISRGPTMTSCVISATRTSSVASLAPNYPVVTSFTLTVSLNFLSTLGPH